MLTIDVDVKPSLIHGVGLFARNTIPCGMVLYYFNPDSGDTMAFISDGGDECVSKEELHYGYSCYHNILSICGDNARYWNFSNTEKDANCAVSDITLNGEPMIYAKVDIPAGTELLVPPSSDLTYDLKMGKSKTTKP